MVEFRLFEPIRSIIGSFKKAKRNVKDPLYMYINLPCNAFQTTLATYTGQNIGAGKIDRVKKGARQTILMSVLLTVLISICIWSFAGPLCHVFEISKAAEAYCFRHLRAIAMINIVLSSYIPLFGLFQGSNHPAVPTVVACSALTTQA